MSKLVKYYESVHSNETIAISEQVHQASLNIEQSNGSDVDSFSNARSILLIQRAKEQASRILDEANHHGRELQRQYIEKSITKLQEMEDQAHRSGYQKGFELKIDEIGDALHTIHKEMRASLMFLKQQNEAIVRQHEDQVKFLALEIASKILHKKVAMDPNELQELVNDTMSGLKNSQKIHVQLPATATALIQKLEEDFRTLPMYEGRQLSVEGGEEGSDRILLECDMGLYDVSIDNQLANLKKLFLENE